MNVSLLHYARPAEVLAKSLLDVWLSGDRHKLRLALDDISILPLPAETNDEFERIDLLRCVAWRMKESADLSAAFAENPSSGIWFDLLRHLSNPPSLRTASFESSVFCDLDSVPAVVRH